MAQGYVSSKQILAATHSTPKRHPHYQYAIQDRGLLAYAGSRLGLTGTQNYAVMQRVGPLAKMHTYTHA